jgi:hypothetical protein
VVVRSSRRSKSTGISIIVVFVVRWAGLLCLKGLIFDFYELDHFDWMPGDGLRGDIVLLGVGIYKVGLRRLRA